MKELNMKPNDSPGALFTFCGLDGCGKTTMLTRLAKEFPDAVLTKEPTPAVRNSEIFRAYTDTPDHSSYDYRSLSLFAASDRLRHGAEFVSPTLKSGKIVISDRYFYSCLANLRARGYKNDDWIYEIASHITKPDVAFFFDVPVPVAVGRVRRRPEEKNRYIDMGLQYALRDEYIGICNKNGGILIDTGKTEDECFEKVLSAAKRAVSEKNILQKLRLISEKRTVRREDRLKADLFLSIPKIKENLGVEITPREELALFTAGDLCDLIFRKEK